MTAQFVVAVGHQHWMARTHDPEKSRARLRTALRDAVADWLIKNGTPSPLAYRVGDTLASDRLRDPEVSVVYLTAPDIARYRDAVVAEVRGMVRR